MSPLLLALKGDFESLLSSKDLDGLEKLLVKFDEACKKVIEQESDSTEKAKVIEQCMNLHDQFEKGLLSAKQDVREQIYNAKANGKKINKYLNV